MIYLDTHVVVWLFAGNLETIPATAKDAIRDNDLLVSPMVVLELQYLYEIGRIAVPPATILSALSNEIGLQVCDLSFAQIAAAALNETWTRDPFDRIIVSHAKIREAALVSKDRHIHEHYTNTIWSPDTA